MEDIMNYILHATEGYILEMVAAGITVSILLWLDRTLTKRGKYILLVVIFILLLALYFFWMFH